MNLVGHQTGWHARALACALLFGLCACSDEETCKARDRETHEWVKGFLSCESDGDCEITKVAAQCLLPFVCPTALSTNVDRPAFEFEARKRQAEYMRECDCWVDKCVEGSELEAYCDSATKLCSHRRKQVQ